MRPLLLRGEEGSRIWSLIPDMWVRVLENVSDCNRASQKGQKSSSGLLLRMFGDLAVRNQLSLVAGAREAGAGGVA